MLDVVKPTDCVNSAPRVVTQETWRTRPVLSAVAAVARARNVSPRQLRNNGARFGYQVRDRQLVMWLARQRGAPLHHIGFYLGFVHATVVQGIRQATRRRQADPEFRRLSDDLLAQLQEGRP